MPPSPRPPLRDTSQLAMTPQGHAGRARRHPACLDRAADGHKRRRHPRVRCNGAFDLQGGAAEPDLHGHHRRSGNQGSARPGKGAVRLQRRQAGDRRLDLRPVAGRPCGAGRHAADLHHEVLSARDDRGAGRGHAAVVAARYVQHRIHGGRKRRPICRPSSPTRRRRCSPTAARSPTRHRCSGISTRPSPIRRSTASSPSTATCSSISCRRRSGPCSAA